VFKISRAMLPRAGWKCVGLRRLTIKYFGNTHTSPMSRLSDSSSSIYRTVCVRRCLRDPKLCTLPCFPVPFLTLGRLAATIPWYFVLHLALWWLYSASTSLTFGKECSKVRQGFVIGWLGGWVTV